MATLNKILQSLDEITIHENIVLKMGAMLLDSRTKTLSELGELLVKSNSDELTNGGFWILEYASGKVYYSPKFCNVLGYDYNEFKDGFDGFNRGDAEQMQYGMMLINDLIKAKSQDSFINKIDFQKKDLSMIQIECSGTVFYKFDKPYLILGTHKIL